MPTFRPPKRGVSLSQALAEAYASAPDTEIILETLEFRHPLFTATQRIVNDHSELLAFLESDAPLNPGEEVTFVPCYFSVKRQNESDSGRMPEFIITVGNISKVFLELNRAKDSRESIQCTYRPYLVSDLTAPHISPPIDLTVNRVTADMAAISIRAGFASLTNRRFPAVEYSAKKFSGLAAR